jgi:hypothetical protein
MIADPQIATLWEFGLFMLAPVALAVTLGTLLRWRDRRLERAVLQDAMGRKTHAITSTNPVWSPFGSVEAPSDVDCNSHQGNLQPKAVA